jgi:predicted naringenin-chalcone synthase
MGAAAVLIAGADTPLAQKPTSIQNPCPRVVATRSTFYRHTEHIMGWDISDTESSSETSAPTCAFSPSFCAAMCIRGEP